MIRVVSLRRERGIAAIVAILIVALATSASSYLLWYQSLARRHVENLVARAQADAIARAGASWAGAILRQDEPKVDHLGEIWAQPLPPFDAEGTTLSGSLEDEQSKLNLNNLVPPNGQGVNANALAAFQRLLVALQLPAELAGAILDWIDTDQEVTQPGGAEDLYYLSLEPPQRAANTPLADISEIRRIKGVTDEVVKKLSPFVTALPTPTKINVNTASAEVLEAAIAGMTRGLATQIVDTRKRTPFTSVAEFTKLLSTEMATASQDAVDVNTKYFTARATVVLGRVTVSYRAILDRTQGAWPRIITMYGESL